MPFSSDGLVAQKQLLAKLTHFTWRGSFPDETILELFKGSPVQFLSGGCD